MLMSVSLREWQYKDTSDIIEDQVWCNLAEGWDGHMHEEGESLVFFFLQQAARRKCLWFANQSKCVTKFGRGKMGESVFLHHTTTFFPVSLEGGVCSSEGGRCVSKKEGGVCSKKREVCVRKKSEVCVRKKREVCLQRKEGVCSKEKGEVCVQPKKEGRVFFFFF